MKYALAFFGLLLASPWIFTAAHLLHNVADALVAVNGIH